MLVRQIRNTVRAGARREQVWSDSAEGQLERNLQRIADIVFEDGARLVVITYPFGELQGFCNSRLRRFASARGLPLVDAAEAYANRCGERHCDELLFHDNHPTAAGHEMIAGALYDLLR
jgi:lysophospholipase L1-like esterase